MGHADLHLILLQNIALFLGLNVSDSGNLHIANAHVGKARERRVKILRRLNMITERIKLNAHNGLFHSDKPLFFFRERRKYYPKTV